MQQEQVFSYGIIGTPKGFQSDIYGSLSKEELVKLDLDSNLYALDPENLFKSLFRVSTLGENVLSIAQYSPATEIGSSRLGGYFGSFVAVNQGGFIAERTRDILQFLNELWKIQKDNGFVDSNTSKYKQSIQTGDLLKYATDNTKKAYEELINTNFIEPVEFGLGLSEAKILFIGLKERISALEILQTILNGKLYLYYENIYFSADQKAIEHFKKTLKRASIEVIENREALQAFSYALGKGYQYAVYCHQGYAKELQTKNKEYEENANRLIGQIRKSEQEINTQSTRIEELENSLKEEKEKNDKLQQKAKDVIGFIQSGRELFDEDFNLITKDEKYVSIGDLSRNVVGIQESLDHTLAMLPDKVVSKLNNHKERSSNRQDVDSSHQRFSLDRLGVIVGLLVILLLNITILVGIWFWPTNQFSSDNEARVFRKTMADQMDKLKNNIENVPNQVKAILPPPPVQQDTWEAPASGKSQGTRTSNKEQERSKQGSKSTH